MNPRTLLQADKGRALAAARHRATDERSRQEASPPSGSVSASALMFDHVHRLLNAIGENRRVMHGAPDRVKILILTGLNRRMERYIRRLQNDLGSRLCDIGYWGPNGAQPAIEDLIASSAFHRRTPPCRREGEQEKAA